MDVLLVDTLAVPGGAERALAHLSAALPAAGARVRALVGEPGPLVEWIHAGGCPVDVTCDLPAAVAAELRARPIDVVLSVGARGHLAAAPAAAAAGVPAVWWMELMPNERPAEIAARALPTAAIMAPSPGVADAQRRLVEDVEVHLVPPGIPVASTLARRSERGAARHRLGWDDEVVVGLVARIDRNKGQTAFIDAAAALVERDDRLRFVLAGGAVLGHEGRLEERLHSLVDRHGLEGRVQLLGHVDDPLPVQAALDVAVSASVHESFGLSVLESMTLGTPVVATRTEGSRFLLEEGAAGWMCDPLDTGALVDAVTAAVAALDSVDDPDELDEVRRAAERASAFDAGATARRAVEVLDQVVSHHRTPRRRSGRTHLEHERITAEDAVELLGANPEWSDSVFTSPAWWGTAVHVLAEGSELRLAAMREGSRAIGVLGVVVEDRRGLTRLVGDPVTDRTGPLHARRDRAAVAAQWPQLLDELVPAGLAFRTDGLASWLGEADPAGSTVAVPCPSIPLTSTWSQYLSAPGSRRRRRIAAQASRLLARPDVHVSEHRTAGELLDALDVLARLHELRFGTDDSVFRGRRGAFLREALAALAPSRAATIRVLHVGDAAAAAILLLHHGSTTSFYQSGWDPAFADLSVGRALLASSIQAAFEVAGGRPGGEATGTFELLRGDEAYKSHWAETQPTTQVNGERSIVFELSRPAGVLGAPRGRTP